MRRFLAVVALTLLSSATLAQTGAAQAKADDLVFMSDNEPAMRRAFQLAKQGLDDFLAKARTKPAELTAFAVKVGVTEGKDVEYFWITDFFEEDGGYAGKIGNEPQMVKNVRYNQTYRFSRDQIVDWLYLDKPKRKMVGNFTYCALLTKESPVDAAAARKRFNLDCET